MSQKTRRVLIGVAGAATLILAFILCVNAIFLGGAPSTAAAQIHTNPTHSAKPKPTPSATPCASSWVITADGNGTAKWLSEGVPSIKDADTNAKAKAAANDWVNEGEKNIYTLAGMVQFILHQSVDASTLRGSDGCATGQAIQYVTQIKMTLANVPIVPSTADSNGYNSARNANGVVVGATQSGVTGDASARKAIQITLPDGSVIWVMARCGNVVTKGPPPPHVPTCQQAGGCSPETCEQLNGGKECKVGSQDPAPSGHAPRGGAVNDNPGTGARLPVTHPSPAYTPPASAPAPDPTTKATPDPQPAPAPEPSAAPTNNPSQGCSPPPGKTTC